MAIPDFQTIMLPLLKLVSDRAKHNLAAVVTRLSDDFGLSQAERGHRLPSGVSTTMQNRVGWARSYLKQAGCIAYPERGQFQITERGLDLLKKNPKRIDIAVLSQFPEFAEFRRRRRTESPVVTDNVGQAELTPIE